jgi:hypothetical protein
MKKYALQWMVVVVIINIQRMYIQYIKLEFELKSQLTSTKI